jgi:hypothetical protein
MNQINHFKVFIFCSSDVAADVNHLHVKRIYLICFSYIVMEDLALLFQTALLFLLTYLILPTRLLLLTACSFFKSCNILFIGLHFHYLEKNFVGYSY